LLIRKIDRLKACESLARELCAAGWSDAALQRQDVHRVWYSGVAKMKFGKQNRGISTSVTSNPHR
jgi:hypothetical protein